MPSLYCTRAKYYPGLDVTVHLYLFFNKLRSDIKGSSSSIGIVVINRWRGLNRFCLLVGCVGVPVPQIINTILCLQEMEGSIKGKCEIYNWEKICNIR